MGKPKTNSGLLFWEARVTINHNFGLLFNFGGLLFTIFQVGKS